MRRRDNKGFMKIIFYLLLLIIVGGGVFMATWDMPAPSTQTEEIIPNARFKK